MILPHVNLLVYAHDEDSAFYLRTSPYWRDLLAGGEVVGLPVVVTLGFVRLITRRSELRFAKSSDEAILIVEDWFRGENVRILTPGPCHWTIPRSLLAQVASPSRLSTDAHLAALAIEHGATLHSHAANFARWSDLA